MKTPKREELTAAVARRHPDWSIAKIEEHLNLIPRSNARAFKKGTVAYQNEQRDYAERLARYNARNKPTGALADALHMIEETYNSLMREDDANGLSAELSVTMSALAIFLNNHVSAPAFPSSDQVAPNKTIRQDMRDVAIFCAHEATRDALISHLNCESLSTTLTAQDKTYALGVYKRERAKLIKGK